MTLSTYIEFLEPVDPERVFGFMRQAIGIPPEHPFEVRGKEWEWGMYENVTRLASIPGGFCAALDVDICPEGATRCGWDWHLKSSHWLDGETETPDIDQCHLSNERWFVRVRLDTSYGYQQGGENCTLLHRRLTQELYEAFPGVAIRWEDEYTGEWHTDAPLGLAV